MDKLVEKFAHDMVEWADFCDDNNMWYSPKFNEKATELSKEYKRILKGKYLMWSSMTDPMDSTCNESFQMAMHITDVEWYFCSTELYADTVTITKNSLNKAIVIRFELQERIVFGTNVETWSKELVEISKEYYDKFVTKAQELTMDFNKTK